MTKLETPDEQPDAAHNAYMEALAKERDKLGQHDAAHDPLSTQEPGRG